MNNGEKNYEIKIITMVINEYLNANTYLTEESLNFLQNNQDQIVWDLAKLIFSQSGYKVELNLIKDVINNRIITIKSHLQEPQNKLINQQVEEKKLPLQVLNVNIDIDNIIEKIITIICGQLDVEDISKITMQSHLVNDLDMNDWGDFTELIMAIEEEFELEISDEETETRLNVSYNNYKNYNQYGSHTLQPTKKHYGGSLGGLFGAWSTEDSWKMPEVNGGNNCIVESLFNLVLEKIVEKNLL